MTDFTISNKHSVYLLAAIPFVAIVLFIGGFYSGTFMSSQTLRSVISEVNTDAKAEVTTAQLEQPLEQPAEQRDLLNELIDKTPPGAGTASIEPPISEAPADKAVTDIVQHADGNVEIVLANDSTQNSIDNPFEKTSHEVKDNERTDKIKHLPTDENNAKSDNKTSKTNQLNPIQVESFSKESNALGLQGKLVTKDSNKQILVSTSPNTPPIEQSDLKNNKLTEKTPPGAGAASIKPPVSETPVDKAVTDVVQHAGTKIEIALVTDNTINEIDTSNKETDNSIKHQPSVGNKSKSDNDSKNPNQLYTIQVGSFSKESNALSLQAKLATKGYNSRILLVTTTPDTSPDNSLKTAPIKKYKVLIGFFASLDTAIQKAYVYTIKERLSSYVIPSQVWRISNNWINKAGLDNKGVFIDYASIERLKRL